MPIDLMTEYMPFWFKVLKVDIVRVSYCKFIILFNDYANLKKEPPPIYSELLISYELLEDFKGKMGKRGRHSLE